MNNKKNTKNILSGFGSQLIILILGLIVPRIILVQYGSDANGVLSTITQIFTYMALLEAGVGQATMNALFPHIHGSEKKVDEICNVMSISRGYYRRITGVYAIAILLLATVLPLGLKTSLNYWTVFGIVAFEGMTGVISFAFVQNWKTLLVADGKSYVQSNIDLFSKTLCYGIKIVLAIIGVNIAYIQLGFFLVSLIKLFIYRQYMAKEYPWLKYQKETSEKKLKDRNSYIVAEIAWTVFSSTDMIILSFFCSTQMASVYSIYNMVFIALNNLLNAVYSSVKFNLGQTYHNDMVAYAKLHDLFNSIFMSIITVLMIVAYYLITPFVTLYTKGIDGVNYIVKGLPLLFCLIQMLSWSRYIAGNLTAVAGYAKKTAKASIIEACLNVILSIVLVQKLNIVGVLLATVLALPVKAVYCNYISDRIVLNRSGKKTISILAVNFVMFFSFITFHRWLNITVKSYFHFALCGIMLTTFLGVVVYAINCMVNRELFLRSKRLIIDIWRKIK